MKHYEAFLKKFMEGWKNLDGESVCDLFASNVKYYENPIDPPLGEREAYSLWENLASNQKDISYKGKILFKDEKSCIYHFVMKRTMVHTGKQQDIDGIFEIKLNDKNELIYFKQWRFTKGQ